MRRTSREMVPLLNCITGTHSWALTNTWLCQTSVGVFYPGEAVWSSTLFTNTLIRLGFVYKDPHFIAGILASPYGGLAKVTVLNRAAEYHK